MSSTTDEKLDRILVYLHHMDRRDRLRTIGGTIRGFLALIPLLFFLYSAWYVYAHGDELLDKISEASARQVMKLNPANSDLMEQFKEYFK